MHSDPEAVRKTIRTYMMVGAALLVFTGITVAVNQIHLAVPPADHGGADHRDDQGSMVAAMFMHLSHEKKWIYGALLLTVVGFVVLMSLPIFTIMDNIGTPVRGRASHTPAHRSTEMSLRAFHLLFIALSVMLAAFCAAWAVGMYRAAHEAELRARRVLSVAAVVGLGAYGAAFQRKNEAAPVKRAETIMRKALVHPRCCSRRRARRWPAPCVSATATRRWRWRPTWASSRCWSWSPACWVRLRRFSST